MHGETFYGRHTAQHQLQTLFQFSASSAPILGTTENATFAHFMKKSMHLKTGYLSDYQVLFLFLNRPQIETIYSLIDRFMTSEGSYTLILPFTSKTGQSVAQNRQNIFFLIWGLLVKSGHILAFYRPNFRLQTYRVLQIELNEQECLPFFIDYYLGIPDTDSRHPRFSLQPFSASQEL